MKVFLTGATGYIGSAIAEALQAAGHTVVGLARNRDAERRLEARGITPVGGDLVYDNSLIDPAKDSDGVIHAGTTNDGHQDGSAVVTMLNALEGTNRPFIYTSGTWVLGNTGDQPADENAPLEPPPIVAWRPSVENSVIDQKEVRGVVVRPGMVYGRGGGLAGIFLQSANETGAARYIGDGQNRWATVHVEDLADLYVRAFEHAPGHSIFHAVDGNSFRMREIAEAASFGADAGGKIESWPILQAYEKLGTYLVDALVLDQVVSAQKARQVLGWEPRGVSLIEDLRYGSYAMNRINP